MPSTPSTNALPRLTLALLLMLGLGSSPWAQTVETAPSGGAAGAASAPPCCGPVTTAGQKLLQVLDGADVEHLWLAHQHVNWSTGQEDTSVSPTAPGHATHCSAFAAAIGERLGVYMLRPPEHGQVLLANAQTAWFGSEAARALGWLALDGPARLFAPPRGLA